MWGPLEDTGLSVLRPGAQVTTHTTPPNDQTICILIGLTLVQQP